MYYTLKNLRNFIKKNKLMFVLMMILQTTSCISMLFAYGVYNNYRYERSSELLESTAITVYFSESVRLSEIKSAMDDVPREVITEANNIQLFSVYSLDGSGRISTPLVDEIKEMLDRGSYSVSEKDTVDIMIEMQYEPSAGKYIFDKKSAEIYRGNMLEGSFITDEEYTFGKNQLWYCRNRKEFSPPTGSSISLCGEIFEVAGRFRTLHEQQPNRIVLSYYAAPDDLRIRSLTYRFEGFVPKTLFDKTSSVFTGRFGDSAEVTKPDELEVSDSSYYTAIMAIAVMFMIIPVINIAVLLFYIMSIRSRIIAVFRIEGGTRSSTVRMFMQEFMLISTADLSAATLLFALVIRPLLGKSFAYFDMIYSLRVYVIFFAAMVCVTAAVLFVMMRLSVSKTPSGQIKGAVK